jgi:predicted transcriptional regulator of viral defense system
MTHLKLTAQPERRLGPREFALLAALRHAGKTTLVLPKDREFVQQHSKRPLRLLSQMANKGLLRRVQRGRYVVLGPGAGSLREELPAFSILDAAFAPRRYAISFLSALAFHGLTDHEPFEVTLLVDLPKGGTAPREIAGVPIRVRAERRDRRWFGIRTNDDNYGAYRIADPERAIVDSVDRPELAGGPEIVVRALSRGVLNGTLRVPRLVRYADRHSIRLARRIGYLLDTLDAASPEQLQVLRARAKQSRRSDSLFGVDADADRVEKNSVWRLETEIPTVIVRSWAAYEEGG